MAHTREGITVHAVSRIRRRGPVLYASLPRDTETPKGHGANGEEVKRRLVSILWDHLMAPENPPRMFRSFSNRAEFPIQVVRDPLGKPHLLLGEHRGPAISFSECGGIVWAALCEDESDMGMDVAEAVEFRGEYPFHRVFNAHELQHVLSLVGGNVEEASALLWSVKEAAVKALGCAFHFVDPLQIHVCPSVGEDDGYTFSARLSGKSLARVPIGAGLWVRSFSREKMWLSIAVWGRHNE